MYSSFIDAILIIDDNSGDLLLLEDEINITTLFVKKIVTAKTLAAAQYLLIQQPFSLIFLDLFLPDSVGLNSFIELQKVNNTIPIIIYSGYEDKVTALKAISLGAQDFLIKDEHSIEILEKTITYSIERKKNLEIIKAHNSRHETLLKVTHDILWEWDMVTDYVLWSGSGIQKYLPKGEFLEKIPINFWIRRLHPSQRKEVLASIAKVIKKGNSFWKCEYRFLRSDGEYDYMYSRGYVINNEDNLPVKMIGSMQDITERKLAELKLSGKELKFKSLTQNSRDIIFLLNREGYCIFAVDSLKNVLGYEASLFVNKFVLEAVHVDDREQVATAFLKVITGDFIEAPPFRIQNSSKEWRWMQSTFVNKLNEQSIAGVIVTSRDITHKVNADQQLSDAALSRHKEITSAMIEGQEKERTEIGQELHDNVNQLLVATKLYMERGMQNQKESAHLFETALTYIAGAIEEIRKLSKTLITPPIKTIGFIESVRSLAQEIMHVNPILINCISKSFNQNILNEKFKLTLFRIVQEQVNNILKHAEAKQVNIIFKQNDEQILISIADNGVGFNTSKRKHGVGISNIFSRAELYKGKVTILSELGKGCIMSIAFNELNLLI